MSNIHFYNIRTKKHEFCNMKDWVLMHAQSLAALMITTCKLINAPVAFSLYGTDGDGYIVADDESFNNSFIMAHEEGHLELGHYLPGANVKFDEHGIIDDNDVEMAADEYAIKKTKDPRGALVSLQRCMEQIDGTKFSSKEKYVKCRLDFTERMLHIANLKI